MKFIQFGTPFCLTNLFISAIMWAVKEATLMTENEAMDLMDNELERRYQEKMRNEPRHNLQRNGAAAEAPTQQVGKCKEAAMEWDGGSQAYYLALYNRDKAASSLPKGANLRALEELAGLREPPPVNCGRISSHAGWHRGKWVRDVCHCGHRFGVPRGSKGKYQCNCCADMAEGGGY